jgi:undecaprenyl pyrophosphate phosphatase UppP
MEIIQSINLLLRFLLELCLLVIFGYWGFKTGQSTLAKIGLGIGIPLIVAVLWGIFLAPASDTRLQEPWRLIAELVIFGLAFAALYGRELRSLAWVLG